MASCCLCWPTVLLETTKRHTQNPAGLMNIGHILEKRNCTFYSDSAVKWFWCQLKSPLELGVLETCALLLQRHLVEWPCHWSSHFRCTKRPTPNRTAVVDQFHINEIYYKPYMLLLPSQQRECNIWVKFLRAYRAWILCHIFCIFSTFFGNLYTPLFKLFLEPRNPHLDLLPCRRVWKVVCF